MVPRPRDLLIIVPFAVVAVASATAGVYLASGLLLVAAVLVFVWLARHQGVATATKEEQAEERLRMSDPHLGGGSIGGSMYSRVLGC